MEEELRQLKEQYHLVARDHRPRLVSIMGPAGIGKSRLSWEFLKYIDGVLEGVWWHSGRSPAYGEGIKVLKVKKDADSPAIAPSAETVRDGSYPLSRSLYIYVSSESAARAEVAAFVVATPFLPRTVPVVGRAGVVVVVLVASATVAGLVWVGRDSPGFAMK